jgi:uncharacterized protein YndB with AHSA1/START domain
MLRARVYDALLDADALAKWKVHPEDRELERT